jgi:7-cyano-7-deazaguanine synthase
MSVLLLSGGIESATLLHERSGTGDLHALFLDYGQRAARAERSAAIALCAATGTPLTVLSLRGVGKALAPPGPFRPHIPLDARNLLAVALAANQALALKTHAVLLGVQRDDRGHSEGALPFITALSDTLAALGLTLETPYRDLRKTEVVARGRALGIDYTRTYSCLLGRRTPCGHCPQCRARTQALGPGA